MHVCIIRTSLKCILNIGYRAIPDHNKAQADMYLNFVFNAQVNVSTVHSY